MHTIIPVPFGESNLALLIKLLAVVMVDPLLIYMSAIGNQYVRFPQLTRLKLDNILGSRSCKRLTTLTFGTLYTACVDCV